MESGHAKDQFNYGGIAPVAVFSYRTRGVASRILRHGFLAARFAEKLTALGSSLADNPRKKRRRVTARGRLGRTIKTAPFAKYAKSRMKRNAPLSESRTLTSVIRDLYRVMEALPRNVLERVTLDGVIIRLGQLAAQARQGVHVNPRREKKNPLAIYGANPPRVKTVRELGRVVEIRYKRNDDGQFYKHDFKTRPRLLALSDGTIAVRP